MKKVHPQGFYQKERWIKRGLFLEKYLKESYEIFSGLLSEVDFVQLIISFENDELTEFFRASFLYKQAIKYIKSNRDVSISLLCSSIEEVSRGSNTIFKDWLIKNKLDDLKNKSEEQLRKTLNRAFQDYLIHKNNQKWTSCNFRNFLTKYCPDELKKPPIKILKGKDDLFDTALRVIHSNFRSHHFHESIGYAISPNESIIDKEFGTPIELVVDSFLLKVSSKYIAFELTKITFWFAEVVKHSLFQYLIKK